MAIALVFLSSCYSNRKAKVNKAIQQTTIQQEQELASIGSLEKSKKEKLEAGKIDSTIDGKIMGNLGAHKSRIDSVKKMMNDLTASIKDPVTLRKSYKKIIKSKLVYLKADNLMFQKRIVNYGLIMDVLNNAKQAQFDLATFFGPGEFVIPPDKMESARTAFTPIVDSMLQFAGYYPAISKNSTIVLKGYADATGIKAGTPLYYRLVNELKQNFASNEELNLAISKLRAASISDIVNSLVQKRQPDFLQQQIVHIEVIQEGRGEEKPNPKIMDYTDNDPRRRIVLFFWTLLPV